MHQLPSRFFRQAALDLDPHARQALGAAPGEVGCLRKRAEGVGDPGANGTDSQPAFSMCLDS